MAYPAEVRIVEVGARDGLQNESALIPAAVKIDFINRLTDAGFRTIEAGSFVSPRWVPQMADSAEVFAAIDKKPGVSYPVLVPNEKGLQLAIAGGACEIALFASASEGFSQKNINCTIEESLARYRLMAAEALARGILVRGYVSCVMDCPYDGPTAPEQVARVVRAFRDMGCYEVSLGDTIGTGTAEKTRALLDALQAVAPVSMLAMHCHDTQGRALECIDVYLQAGGNVIDSSTGGLGGCPYAKSATGNVATEKVLAFLEEKGIRTGVDPKKVAAAAEFIANYLKNNS